MLQSHCFESRVSLQFECLLNSLKFASLFLICIMFEKSSQVLKDDTPGPKRKKKNIGEDRRCKNKCVGFNIKGRPYQGHQKLLPYVFSSYIFGCITHTKGSYLLSDHYVVRLWWKFPETCRLTEEIHVSFQELLGTCKGFPGGASGKEPTCQCRRHKRRRFNYWVKKVLWRRATHSSIFAWRIPWSEEPGGLQSMGS